jgi:predicted MFS family arabinose efflux permease
MPAMPTLTSVCTGQLLICTLLFYSSALLFPQGLTYQPMLHWPDFILRQGCIFAPSIGLLVAFRALQGAAVAGYGATGSAIIADVYAPHERGTAMGISTIPMVSSSMADVPLQLQADSALDAKVCRMLCFASNVACHRQLHCTAVEQNQQQQQQNQQQQQQQRRVHSWLTPFYRWLLLLQLVGPILGPILGGALSQAFSWRSTFIAIAMYAAVIILPMLAFLPETHHYKKLQKLQKADPDAAATVQEREAIFETPPVFKAPYYPLQVWGLHRTASCLRHTVSNSYHPG